MTSIHPERRVGTSVCSWNILYFSVPHKSTTLLTNPRRMSLSDSITALRHALQAETPTSAHLSELGTLWTEAHQHALRGKLRSIQQQAEAEIQAAATSAQATLLAQIQRAEDAARAAAAASVAQAQVSEAVPATEAPIAPPKPAPVAATPEASPAPVAPVASATPTAPAALEAVEAPWTPPTPEAPVAPVVPTAPEAAAPVAAATAAPVAAAQTTTTAPAHAKSPAAPSLTPSAGSAKSVNARYAGLKVGLNDRVAFVKHLFNGEDDDFQRVVAALATMESKQECETFLENAVYPDYDWTQKPEFAERFLALVFARFE